MVEVRVALHDSQERHWFGQFMSMIDQYRAGPAPENLVNGNREATAPAIVTPAGTPAEVISDISPEAVTVHPKEKTAGLPSDAAMFDALREVLRKEGGYVAAQAILAKHGVSKVTDEMTDEVRVALYAELTK